MPGPFHLEVAVDGDAGIGSQQNVFPAGDNRGDNLACQIHRGESGHPELGSRQLFCGDGFVETAGGDEHCVAFRHGSILRAPS